MWLVRLEWGKKGSPGWLQGFSGPSNRKMSSSEKGKPAGFPTGLPVEGGK